METIKQFKENNFKIQNIRLIDGNLNFDMLDYLGFDKSNFISFDMKNLDFLYITSMGTKISYHMMMS